jgi:purine catabolism regulator
MDQPSASSAAASELTGAFTLEDLLREESFRLELVAGAADHLPQPVGGAVSVDAEDVGPWLQQDWILLTSGSALPDDTRAHQRLIARLDAAGVAALGLCLGTTYTTVPPALVAEADRRGVTIFTVPRRTPAAEIVAFVQRNLMSEEVLAFNRMAAFQAFLLDALGRDDPRRVLIERLAELIGAKVGVLSASGEFEIVTSGSLPGPRILEELVGGHVLTMPFSVEGFHGQAFAVGEPERSDVGWLVVAVPDARRLHPLAKAAGSATVPLLAAIERLDRVERLRDGAARRATFDALLEADTPQAARVAGAQLGTCGINIESGVSTLIFEGPPHDISSDELFEKVVGASPCLGKPTVGTIHDGRVSILLPAPVTDEMMTALMSAIGIQLRVGVGRTVVEALQVRRSLSEAALAVGASSESRLIRRYDDLDFGTLVLQELQLERLAPKIEAWLEPLRSSPRVFETLVTYLENNLDVGRTAAALHLHPNSVRYRLSRAEDLIGAPVRAPGTMIALHVAIAAAQRAPETPPE